MPEIKKYLNRNGLEDYNALLPHSAGAMQEYVDAWLEDHPEATTTVQDGSITTQKLADASVTRAKLAADVVHLLCGMMITKELEGELLTAQDAWNIEPLALTIDGKSTQAGTPTPETPIPIQSIEVLNMLLHASADGATDETNWPVSINMQGNVLRSLPSGYKDTIEISYLRPSTRNSWAIYAAMLTQRVGSVDLGDFTWYARPSQHKWYTGIPMIRSNTNVSQRMCTHYTVIASQGTNSTPANNTISPRSVNDVNSVYVRDDRYPPDTTSADDFKEAITGVRFDYLMNEADYQTRDLGEIELPILPAPNCIMWSEPNTGLKLSYMCNSSIVISNIEQAVADL